MLLVKLFAEFDSMKSSLELSSKGELHLEFACFKLELYLI